MRWCVILWAALLPFIFGSQAFACRELLSIPFLGFRSAPTTYNSLANTGGTHFPIEPIWTKAQRERIMDLFEPSQTLIHDLTKRFGNTRVGGKKVDIVGLTEFHSALSAINYHFEGESLRARSRGKKRPFGKRELRGVREGLNQGELERLREFVEAALFYLNRNLPLEKHWRIHHVVIRNQYHARQKEHDHSEVKEKLGIEQVVVSKAEIGAGSFYRLRGVREEANANEASVFGDETLHGTGGKEGDARLVILSVFVRDWKPESEQ